MPFNRPQKEAKKHLFARLRHNTNRLVDPGIPGETMKSGNSVPHLFSGAVLFFITALVLSVVTLGAAPRVDTQLLKKLPLNFISSQGHDGPDVIFQASSPGLFLQLGQKRVT